MYYNNPSYRKDNKSSGNLEEGYKFKEVASIHLTLNTNAGGWERQEPSKNSRVFVVKKGMGTVKVQGKSHVLEKDVILDIPEAVLVEMEFSQVEYYTAKSTNGEKISVTEKKNEGGWKSLTPSSKDRVFIIKDGLGFVKLNHKTYRLNPNDVLELPANTEVELSGPIDYFEIVAGN